MAVYFFIKESYFTQKIGTRFPQVSDYIDNGYDFSAEYSILKIKFSQKIDFELKLPIFKLFHKARLTDVISCNNIHPGNSFLVSERFVGAIKAFKICGFQIFPAQVFHRSKIYSYFFLFFYDDTNRYIDFVSSEFYSRPFTGINFEQIPIKIVSLNDFYEKLESCIVEKKFLFASKLVFKSEIEDFDFFRTHKMFNAFYISQRLFEAFEKEKITGLDYLPFENGIFEVPRI